MVNLDRDGYPNIIFEWCLFALVTVCVIIRLYVQLRFRHKPWRELFVIVAWSLYLAYTVCESLQNGWDAFNDTIDWSLKTDADMTPMLKAVFTESVVYKPILYACKAALLCLYMDITQKRTKLWYALWFTWVFVTIGAVFQVLEVFLMCTPLSRNWTFSQMCEFTEDESEFNAYWNRSRALDTTSYVIHIFTDFLVYLLPFFILAKLRNLSSSRKKEIYSLFALGFFNIASAIMLFVYQVFFNLSIQVNPKFFYAIEFLMPFQAGTALLIICAPYIRRLWHGTKAKDLRPELNTGNMAIHHRACGPEEVDVEAANNTGRSSTWKSKASEEVVSADEKS